MDWIGWVISGIGTLAAIGAWWSAWHPTRFVRSWELTFRKGYSYTITNRTRRRAEDVKIEVLDPLNPDDPTPSAVHIDGDASVVEDGEALALRAPNCISVTITWTRRRLGRKVVETTVRSLPIQYA